MLYCLSKEPTRVTIAGQLCRLAMSYKICNWLVFELNTSNILIKYKHVTSVMVKHKYELHGEFDPNSGWDHNGVLSSHFGDSQVRYLYNVQVLHFIATNQSYRFVMKSEFTGCEFGNPIQWDFLHLDCVHWNICTEDDNKCQLKRKYQHHEHEVIVGL